MKPIYYGDLKRHLTKSQLEKSLGRLMLKYIKVPRVNIRTSINNQDQLQYSFNLMKKHKNNQIMTVNPNNLSEITLIYGDQFSKCFSHAFNSMKNKVSSNPHQFLTDYKQTFMKMRQLRKNRDLKLTDKNKTKFEQLPSMQDKEDAGTDSQQNNNQQQSNPNQQSLFKPNDYGQGLNPNDYKND